MPVKEFRIRAPDFARKHSHWVNIKPLAAMLNVKRRALEIGFDLAGVAPTAAWKDLEFSRRWVARGFVGEMRYLSNPERCDPRRILPSVQSVVCVGLIYNAPLPYSEEVKNQKSEGRSRGSGERGRAASSELRTPNPEPRGWISRYAWGQDYHEIMRAKLEVLRTEIEKSAPGVETRVFVDTGPIVERAFARLSGIGWMGKNTCLINEQKGSWLFLGLILTSLALTPDLPAPDRCGSCTACLEACPTGALVEPYVMDASRCISHLNIELKGSIPEEFRTLMGNNIFGCDICQDVCPWNGRPSSVVHGPLSVVSGQSPVVNRQAPEFEYSPRLRSIELRQRRAATTTAAEFQPLTLTAEDAQRGNWKMGNRDSKFETRNSAFANRQSSSPESRVPGPESRVFSLFNPSLETLASLSQDDFRRIFAHSPIKRAKYRGWLRNLCVAMGNSGDARFVPKLEELAAHPDPVVREHAAWALERLTGIGIG